MPQLKSVAVPNLPFGGVDYTKNYQDQYSNVLRLYFNQLTNNLNNVTNTLGGQYISNPFIAALCSYSLYATADNTPTIVEWDSATNINGFTLNANNTATANVSGIFKITYSAQLANNDNAPHFATFWLRLNGVDVPGSTTIFSLQARQSASVWDYRCGYSEVVFPMEAGDTVGLWWGTDQAAVSGGANGIYIFADTAQTTPMPRPSVPSMIGSITFVSAM
jgi:hypothetical protein